MAAGEPGSPGPRSSPAPGGRDSPDPALDRLVEAVPAANPDMRVAGLKLKNAPARRRSRLGHQPHPRGQRQSRGQRHQEHERWRRQQQPGPLNLSYEVILWGRLAAARIRRRGRQRPASRIWPPPACCSSAGPWEQLAAGPPRLGHRPWVPSNWPTWSCIERLTRARRGRGRHPTRLLVQASQQKAGKQAELATLSFQAGTGRQCPGACCWLQQRPAG